MQKGGLLVSSSAGNQPSWNNACLGKLHKLRKTETLPMLRGFAAVVKQDQVAAQEGVGQSRPMAALNGGSTYVEPRLAVEGKETLKRAASQKRKLKVSQWTRSRGSPLRNALRRHLGQMRECKQKLSPLQW